MEPLSVIRTFEITKKGIAAMNQAYQSKVDIQGMDFSPNECVEVKRVQMANCLKLNKDGVISPIEFVIPRKREQFFQDDLYSEVLDLGNVLSLSLLTNKGKLDVSVSYNSLKPDDMELLSEAPKEQLSDLQRSLC